MYQIIFLRQGKLEGRDSPDVDDESINACRESPGDQRKGQTHVYIPIYNYKVKGIFDTGSSRTVMSYSLLNALLANGVNLSLEETDKVRIRGISGQQLKIIGRVNFPFTFGKIKFQHPVLIVENMRDILIIGNDLMDNRITIHKGQQITINDKDTEETLQLCREFPKYGLRLKEQEELAPRTAKLVICKCGLIDKEGNIPTKLLLTGENTTGLYIPRLVALRNSLRRGAKLPKA